MQYTLHSNIIFCVTHGGITSHDNALKPEYHAVLKYVLNNERSQYCPSNSKTCTNKYVLALYIPAFGLRATREGL